MKKIILLLILISSITVQAQDIAAYERKTFTYQDKRIDYRVLFPKDYDATKPYPVITFLHGSGERGTDNIRQLTHGGALFASDSVRALHSYIIIFPQLYPDSVWRKMTVVYDTAKKERVFSFQFSKTPSTAVLLVKKLLDSLVQVKIANAKQLYIGGLSLGGMGTFDMLERYPGFFAAAFPICGGGDEKNAARFAKKTPVWIFHGGADGVVSPGYSRRYYAALKKLTPKVTYTEYPGVGHNSWDYAFKEPGLLPWLLAQKKK